MGSPLEACESLKVLLAKGGSWGVQVVGVVSQPARPAGRKKQLQDPPVATFAKQNQLFLLQPEKASEQGFLNELQTLKPDLIVTAAYGQILSDQFLKVPTRATINIHPSLLPKYRGATPIPSALLAGDTKSGVTVLFTVKKLDAGNIIAQTPVDFGTEKTTGELMPELFAVGGEMLGQAVAKLRDPQFKGEPQDDAGVTHCGKFSKDDGNVAWARSAEEIFHRYRAFSPWPGVFTFHQGVRIKLTELAMYGESIGLGPGEFKLVGQQLIVGTSSGALEVVSLMRAGSKAGDGKAFINGLKAGASHLFSDNEAAR
jgi:methionyl-tRNA formyltransferase